MHRAFKPLSLMLFLGLMLLGFVCLKSIESIRHAPLPTPEAIETKWTSLSKMKAEVGSRSKIKLDEEPSTEVSASQPLLPEDRPDWVAQPDSVDGDIHRIAIGTELASSIEECRNKLDIALLDGMRQYVDEHLSNHRKLASKLTELHAPWIRKNLMDSDTQFEAILDRPAGTYHQLWVQLEIDPRSRGTIMQWLQRLETQWRAGAVGVVAGGCVLCLSLLNVGLSLFAKKL